MTCYHFQFEWMLAGKVVARESTLGSRPLPCKQFQTPAPGEYDIDKIDKSKLQTGGCVRGYTFGHPNVNHKPNRTPGKSLSRQTEWKPFVENKIKLI